MRTGFRATGSAGLRLAAMMSMLAVASCAGLDRNDQGRLQPQTVSGPCQVKKFFLLAFRAVRTDIAVGNTGQACRFTLLDANLQATPTAILVMKPPAHGRATAALITGGRQAAISYVPEPGYAGPDQFTVTMEPDAFGMVFSVTVAGQAP